MRHFYKHFSLTLSNNTFRYQPFLALFGNLGGKVPIVDDVLSSHEQENYPTPSLDENCLEFEFQTDRNYFVDLRLFRCLFWQGNSIFPKDVVTLHTRVRKREKEHKNESVVFTEVGTDEE